MKVAIIESVPATPHLETAGEIALRLKKKNFDVSFCWVGFDLHWNDWDLNVLYKLFGGSYSKKIEKFKELLINKKIKVEDMDFNINKKKIFRWANNFNGDLNSLKRYKYDSCSLGISVASSLMSYLKNPEIDPQKNKKKVLSLLISSAIVYERTKKYILINKPKIIYTFNNRFATCYPIICAANKLNIKVIRHERGSSFTKFEVYKKDVHDVDLTKKNISFHWSKNKDKDKIKKANKYFFDKITGRSFKFDNSEIFTKNQKKNSLPTLPKNKRIITFFTSRDYEKQAIINMKFDQFKAFKKFKKIIDKFKDIHLVIRVHPNFGGDKSYDDDVWSRYSSEKVTVINSYEKYDSYALMLRSNINVTYTSTIIVESAFFKKPSISIGKFFWTGWWWSGQNIIEEPKNVMELEKMLSKNYKFKKRNNKACLQIANYYLNYGTNFKYYKPISKNNGTFLKVNLSWKPKVLIFLEKFGIFNNFVKIFKKNR